MSAEKEKRSIWPFVRPHAWAIVLILALHAGGVAAQIGMIELLAPIIAESSTDDDFGDIIVFGVYLLLLTGVFAGITAITSRLASKVSSAIVAEMRNSMIEAMMDMDEKSVKGWSSTRAMTSLVGDMRVVQEYLSESLRFYMPMPILMAALLARTSELNEIVGAALLVVFLAVCGATYLLGKRMRPLYDAQSVRLDGVNRILREKIPGGRMIRAFDGRAYEEERFEAASAKFGETSRSIALSSYYVPVLSTASVWILVLGAYLVAAMVGDEEPFVFIDLMLFMQYTAYIVGTMSLIPFLCLQTPRAYASMDKILDVLCARRERGSPGAFDPEGDAVVSVRDAFTADGKLRGASFDIMDGETVTIAGPNGSGESELVSAMMGFSACSSGKITVLGEDATTVDPKELRERVAYCGNSLSLFRGPIRRSIDPHGRLSDGKIMDACRLLGLDATIESLPGGLDFETGDESHALSGGQRQMVAVARSILRPARIHVFDDCFFSLDAEARHKAMAAIGSRCEGTVVFVMHDLSTASASDRVIVMDHGRVAQEGSPKELEASSERYRELLGRLGAWERGRRSWDSPTSLP